MTCLYTNQENALTNDDDDGTVDMDDDNVVWNINVRYFFF